MGIRHHRLKWEDASIRAFPGATSQKMGSLPADSGTLKMAFGVQNYAECWPRSTTAQPSLEPFTEASSLTTRHNPGLGIMPQRMWTDPSSEPGDLSRHVAGAG